MYHCCIFPAFYLLYIAIKKIVHIVGVRYLCYLYAIVNYYVSHNKESNNVFASIYFSAFYVSAGNLRCHQLEKYFLHPNCRALVHES